MHHRQSAWTWRLCGPGDMHAGKCHFMQCFTPMCACRGSGSSALRAGLMRTHQLCRGVLCPKLSIPKP